MKYPTEILQFAIPWIGKHILHLSYEITVFTNGSGDTTYDYVIVLAIFSTAIIATVIWSIIDGKRDNYVVWYYWLTVAVRFYIGLMLINYGLFKVVKLQFPSPGIYRLLQPYGESSPMGLAWTFLGFSKGYNFFMGVAELTAALLLFRRTMTAGAIVTLMTTTNVMAVNYFYDVPVKIISTALVMMTLFLLAKDAKKLFRFFFTQGPVNLSVIPGPVITKRWIRIGMMCFKFVIIGYVVVSGAIGVITMDKQYGSNAPKPKLYGAYTVGSFMMSNNPSHSHTTDSARWKLFTIEWPGFAQVKYMNDSVKGFTMKLDTVEQTIDLSLATDYSKKYYFKYEIPDTSHFILRSKMTSDSVSIFFNKRNDLETFRLMNRRFNWINEYPYNR